MEVFVYAKDSSFKDNFNRWHYMNQKERQEYGEPLLTNDQAWSTFCSLHGKHAPPGEKSRLRTFLGC